MMMTVLRPTWDLDTVAAVVHLFLESLGHTERQPGKREWRNLRNILSFEVKKKGEKMKAKKSPWVCNSVSECLPSVCVAL